MSSHDLTPLLRMSCLLFGDRRVAVLSQLSTEAKTVSQREMARLVGVSSSLVNAYLRQASQSGLIKVRAVNKKQAQYGLTDRGLRELRQQSSQYVSKMLECYQSIQESVAKVVNDLYAKGYRAVTIRGQGPLRDLVQFHIRALDGMEILADKRRLWGGVAHVICDVGFVRASLPPVDEPSVVYVFEQLISQGGVAA